MKMSTKLFVLVITLLITFTVISAKTLEETFKKQIPAEDITFLSIDTQNGGIEVEGWDQGKIEIVAYKRVRASNPELARKMLDEIEIDIRTAGNRVEVETLIPNRRNHKSGFLSWLFDGNHSASASVEYVVKIPVKMDLDLNSTNGGINISKCDGQIDLRTTNGKIIADEISGALNCKTTNGSIKAYLFAVDPTEDMNFKTTNGSINVYLPEKLNAELEASTTNGSINCELPISSSRSQSKRKLYGKINDGGPLLYLKTTNGSIRINEI